MSGVRRNPNTPGGKYQGWYTNYAGERQYVTGTHSRTQTRDMMRHLEDEHRQMALGYVPIPSGVGDRRPIQEVFTEYQQWGGLQGGVGGRPWSAKHQATRTYFLAYWKQTLGLEDLSDLVSCLPQVERALQTLAVTHRSTSMANYLRALQGFCRWCVDHDYLQQSPLAKLAALHSAPVTIRRALTGPELQRLLRVCPLHRRLLYEVAVLSGLRVGELRRLTVEDLDRQRGGVHLRGTWTKNRQDGFQPLPLRLVTALAAFVQSGQAQRLANQAYRRRGVVNSPQEQPLLYVPNHPAVTLTADCARAGIPRVTSAGKVDFHALRVASVSFVIEAGASVKEAQTHARHADPSLTMNTYARSRTQRHHELVETMDTEAFGAREGNRGARVQAEVVGGNTPILEHEHPPEERSGLIFHPLRLVTRDPDGSTPDPPFLHDTHDTRAQEDPQPAGNQPAEKRGTDVHGLEEVIRAWPILSEETRQQILGLLQR